MQKYEDGFEFRHQARVLIFYARYHRFVYWRIQDGGDVDGTNCNFSVFHCWRASYISPNVEKR